MEINQFKDLFIVSESSFCSLNLKPSRNFPETNSDEAAKMCIYNKCLERYKCYDTTIILILLNKIKIFPLN